MRISETIKLFRKYRIPIVIGILLVVLLFLFGQLTTILKSPNPPESAGTVTQRLPTTPTAAARTVKILVDDFRPQPYQGEKVYYYNRLDGDRGASNNSVLDWANGQVTMKVSPGNSWGGGWMSLNHPIREGQGINFSAILPAQILPAYQSKITAISILISSGTRNRPFRIELKDGNQLRWKNEAVLNGGQQTIHAELPALGNITQLVWVLDRASPGDYIVLKEISFTATNPLTDSATAGFVWSYGMLLDNWNPATGLVRDKAKDPSGDFDAIQTTGSLAAATAIAEQMGIVNHTDAAQIVKEISEALLVNTPRFHGLWPHWVKTSAEEKFTIVENTEWSSVDTVIAALGLLEAQSALQMDTSAAEQMLQAVDWQDLLTPTGISHGYTYAGERIPYAWDAFGGESWLVELAYAAATGRVAPLAYSAPPTANGSGFIDEMAWLYVAAPAQPDTWGTDWQAYRKQAAGAQLSYYPDHYPASCFTRIGLFGLSAGEVPDPSGVKPQDIYQAFGLGGHFAPTANDGVAALGTIVVAPHYSAMIALLHPQEAVKMWDWLIQAGLFSPLNNVESLEFEVNAACDSASLEWNQLKGSWNLSMQTLGWGRYLAERDGKEPVLWQAAAANPFLRKGYLLLVTSIPEQAEKYSPVPSLTATQ